MPMPYSVLLGVNKNGNKMSRIVKKTLTTDQFFFYQFLLLKYCSIFKYSINVFINQSIAFMHNIH